MDVGIANKYMSLKEVRKQINAKEVPLVTLRAMIMEIRATMMTDSSQALGLNGEK